MKENKIFRFASRKSRVKQEKNRLTEIFGFQKEKKLTFFPCLYKRPSGLCRL